MKIGLIGYGKMGKAVEKAALEKGHEIVARLTREADLGLLEEADVCIDFTAPDAVWKTIEFLAPFKKNLVIGTTGWEKHLAQAQELAASSPFGLLYAPNFSIGMYILKKLLEKGAELVRPFDFDVAGLEMHHQRKKDAPSGSAKALSRTLFESLGQDIPFTSIRVGSITGIHQVLFNSIDDTIELTHRASSRMGFARGALAAAEWLQGKVGFYTFDDFMEEVSCNLKE